MAHWTTLDRRETRDGVYELRRRGDDEFLITVAGRVLMNSRQSRSEEALAQLALEAHPAPERVLVGGLGMGITLRRALAGLGPGARVLVVELQAHVADWCRGPLATVNSLALSDARVQLRIGDVAEEIAASDERGETWDVILLDLFEGPHARTPDGDPLYGDAALAATWRALRRGGVLAVWSEDPDARFERRLAARGFELQRRRPGRGGRRHAVYIARRR